MKVSPTALDGVLLIEVDVYGDARGSFIELFQEARYAALDIPGPFLQDNLSRSVRGTLRGLHFQEPDPQGKLVQVLEGAVLDVVVDVRRGSPQLGRWLGTELSAENRRQLWIPPGYAHGFCVTSETAVFFYKCTSLYAPACERTIVWDDPELGIAWPVPEPILSAKDRAAPRLREAPVLPAYPAP